MTARPIDQIRAEFAAEEERLESLAKSAEAKIRALLKEVQQYRYAPFYVTAEELASVCDAFRAPHSPPPCWALKPGHEHRLIVKIEEEAS